MTTHLAAGEVDLPADQLYLGRGVRVEEPHAARVAGVVDGPPTARPQPGQTGAAAVEVRLEGPGRQLGGLSDLVQQELGVQAVHALAHNGAAQLTGSPVQQSVNKNLTLNLKERGQSFRISLLHFCTRALVVH